MVDTELQELLTKIARLEDEQRQLKEKLTQLENEQEHDHELIITIQQQLATMYREIEDVKRVLTVKIEEGNNLILEQNKLMMEASSKQSLNFFKLITLLIAALLILVGVKGIGSLPFF